MKSIKNMSNSDKAKIKKMVARILAVMLIISLVSSLILPFLYF